MELPMKPSEPARINPKEIVIFGKPKCGKTTISAQLTLEGKWLLISLEPKGADFVSATKVQVNNIKELKQLGLEIIKQGRPYDGIILDTVTKLEEMILPLAKTLYCATPMGVNWDGDDVKTLPKGAGYLFIRQAFFQVMNFIGTLSHNIIYVGHLADKMIDKKGEEVSSVELDLTGKLSKLVCAEVDAIAYCYRKDNQTILNFRSSEEVVCGSRCDHLRGQEIVIAESDDNGVIKTFWEKVFLPGLK
jgi:hypothetical protein